MSWEVFLNGVSRDGAVFLKDVFRRCPQVVINYRIMLYAHAKSCKWNDVLRFLEEKFPGIENEPLENPIKID